jgi:hypothetical protein
MTPMQANIPTNGNDKIASTIATSSSAHHGTKQWNFYIPSYSQEFPANP